jgi:hypothetical protein
MGPHQAIWLARSGTIAERDLNEVISLIKGMDAEEIAVVLALAADFRNSDANLRESLLDIYRLCGKDYMMLPFELSQLVKQLQQQKKYSDAGAVMVWLHTVRCAQHPQVRYLAKQMWGELERGFPLISLAAQEIERIEHRTLIIDRATEFPEGLNPHL